MFKIGVAALSVSLLAVPAMALEQPSRPENLPPPLSDADFHPVDPDWAALGQLLFFDPLLSGNRNISCATCHHPSLGTSDAMSLSMGEGGVGLGPSRVIDTANRPTGRIPRNAPALFNLGAREFRIMFHDGRVMEDAAAPHGIRMPLGRELERAVPSALAAQNILPLLSAAEMSGNPGENDIADAVAEERIAGPDGAWALIAGRVATTPGYAERFAALGVDAPHISDIAIALSSFISVEFRADGSIFDAWLAGETRMPLAAERGADLFYGKAGCSECHSGALLTDQGFHAIAMPQIGPGKSDYARDEGRFAVTGDRADLYRFRTPSLRNIGLTAPYGHAGAYGSLETVVRHHLDPVASLMDYDHSEAALHLDLSAEDFAAQDRAEERRAIAAANELMPVVLSETEIADILEFLRCLTDPESETGRMGVPATVPSGLPIDG